MDNAQLEAALKALQAEFRQFRIETDAEFHTVHKQTSSRRGPEGPRGEKGEPGISNVPGPQGPQGPRGLQGEPGVSNVPGPTGMTGPQGARGAQGERGPQGEPGRDGKNGECGPMPDVNAIVEAVVARVMEKFRRVL